MNVMHISNYIEQKVVLPHLLFQKYGNYRHYHILLLKYMYIVSLNRCGNGYKGILLGISGRTDTTLS